MKTSRPLATLRPPLHSHVVKGETKDGEAPDCRSQDLSYATESSLAFFFRWELKRVTMLWHGIGPDRGALLFTKSPC